jgi:hypothetical protein
MWRARRCGGREDVEGERMWRTRGCGGREDVEDVVTYEELEVIAVHAGWKA